MDVHNDADARQANLVVRESQSTFCCQTVPVYL